MIGYFPIPLPDETVFSICARYRTRTGLPERKVRRKLFGYTRYPSFRFQNRLAFLANQLSWTGTYTEEQILQNHTFFPICKPFLSRERRNYVKEQFLGNYGNNINRLIGCHSTRFSTERSLRFCPLCSQEDRERHGVLYWHRLHQFVEVLVCPVHRVMLENVPNIKPNHTSFMQDADSLIPVLEPRLNREPLSQCLQMVAESFFWLLTTSQDDWDSRGIARAYKKILRERNLVTYSSYGVSAETLTNRLNQYYSESFLSSLGICLAKDKNQRNWLTCFVANTGRDLPPIRHIILIRALGFSLAEFYQYVISL